MAEMCRMIYHRVPSHEPVECTFVAGHPIEKHSWETLRVQDEADAEARKVWSDSSTPNDVLILLSNIRSGNADPYLEAILSVCHNRKRALRGVRGFDELML